MAKVELKTQKNNASVDAFLKTVPDESQRADCLKLLEIMESATGESAAMWGASIVGFGTYHYKSPATGREADWLRIGFSPRKGKTTIYIMDGFDAYQSLLDTLGKHSTAKSCLYIKHLDDIDIKVLTELIKRSFHEGLPMGGTA